MTIFSALRSHLSRSLGRWRAPLSAILVAGIAGTTVAAVGIAPLLPDPAALPRRLVEQAIEPRGIAQQLDALAALELPLQRSTVTRSAESLESLLGRLGVVDSRAGAFLRRDPQASRALQGRGRKLQATHSVDGGLLRLVVRFAADGDRAGTHFQRLTIEPSDSGWRTSLEIAPLERQVRLASGTIRHSLFAATEESGLPDSIAVQLAEVFSADIDFHRELRKGDTFSLVYETLTADGEPVTWGDAVGRVLAAEFVNRGKIHEAVWFSGSDGDTKGAYYGFDGRSRQRAFLASPLEFSRVTSGFAMRMHPILNTWRAHLGVDYSAPQGTPVRSVGEGKVEFAGRQNGYGNVVSVDHGHERSTLYAHLSRIDVRKGERVAQGQVLGSVGATGWATGPHLHFEFRIDGRHQDPLEIARTAETRDLDPGSRIRFAQVAGQLKPQLDIAETLASRRNAFE